MIVFILFLFIIMVNIDIYQFLIINNKYMGFNSRTFKNLNKRDCKQHKKDCKDLRKELKDFVDKDFGPWGNYLNDFLEIQIKYWIKYYSLGYNVNCEEYPTSIKKGYLPMPKDGVLPPTRLEIAKTLQILLYRYTDFLLGLTDDELLEYEENPNSFPSGLLLNRMKEFRNKYYYIDDEGKLYFDSDRMNEDYDNCRKELFDYYAKWSLHMCD